MKKFSPVISAFLVASMFYILYQLNQVAKNTTDLASILHEDRILLLFSICGILAIGLSLSGFKSLDDGLKYVSYFGFFGSIILVLLVWLLPFFV
ncbi:hypothetical protein Fleli_2131 [Bernardetia litoralis DSM 6794]|uniref:Uncharacterized protein n=1 Tax=Bernardetia litoralis (strain ATCC 23117 / DSM 6794 / NBRC 15988 / NCIMB 1366 / Fx l1 / Sio-4) TaxID=880071 RepID=I4AKM8_BERLS|nr:hypothetical protein [Bernardetia litoralis]AFM04513.1 hypothetical protein Fleli_2131 [Bernardetia litoralis DSM 6794]